MAEVQQEIEFSEAELTGESDAPEGEKAEAAPGEAATPKEPESEKEKPAEAAKEPEPAPAPVKEERRVPLKEYITERQKRQELETRIKELEAEKTAEPVKDPAALILEDPEEAVRLLMRQNTELRQEMDRRDLEREIKSEVPDFFDLAPKMEETLLDEGLSEESIRSIIGASGKDAPKLFKVLAKVAKNHDEQAIRDRIIAEETPKITRSLMEKFKITEPGKNIGNLPGASPDGKLNVNNEKDYAKLTPEMQEKWLAGEI